MQSMSADPASARTTADRLVANSREITRSLHELDEAVGSLVGQWSGTAQEAYHRAQREWTASTTKMDDLLERISRSTHEMVGAYATNDRTIADDVSR